MCVWGVRVCLVYLQNGGGWRNIWGCVLSLSDLAAIEEISCSLRHLRSKPLHPSLRSFTFALDPSPIQISTTFFPHRLQFFFFFFFAPPTHTMAVSSIRCPPPSSSVCLHPRKCPAGFSTLYSLDFYLFLPPPLPLSSLLIFLRVYLSPPLWEAHGPDEHREAGTNQSIDLSTYPSLCSTDRQQKTKCLLSETFPISLPHPPSPRLRLTVLHTC